ncbi:MAG TPA: hypothetical protein VK395_22505 [Gemmataceae bacterium]|nr:hypothetical protein [Gemmataceae bacterium]
MSKQNHLGLSKDISIVQIPASVSAKFDRWVLRGEFSQCSRELRPLTRVSDLCEKPHRGAVRQAVEAEQCTGAVIGIADPQFAIQTGKYVLQPQLSCSRFSSFNKERERPVNCHRYWFRLWG